jgi:hypothetical protein
VTKLARLLLTAVLLTAGLLAAATSAAEAQRRGRSARSSYSRSYAPRSARSSSYRAPRTRTYRAPAYPAPRARTYHPQASTVRAPRAYRPRASRAPSYSVGGPARDSRGRIRRSQGARWEFMRATGYPHGRPGYVIDHVVPLACGGADAPSNMQWQTREAAKAKDRVERRGCGAGRRR